MGTGKPAVGLTERFARLRTTYSRTAGYDTDLWQPIADGIAKLEAEGNVAKAVLELIAAVEEQEVPPEAILELVKTALKQFSD